MLQQPTIENQTRIGQDRTDQTNRHHRNHGQQTWVQTWIHYAFHSGRVSQPLVHGSCLSKLAIDGEPKVHRLDVIYQARFGEAQGARILRATIQRAEIRRAKIGDSPVLDAAVEPVVQSHQ